MSLPVLAIVKNGKIEPINPIDLPEGTRLLLLPNPSTEAFEWSGLSLAGLSHAYSDDEPDYDLIQLELEQQRWDRQIESDFASGKLDRLIAEAEAEFEAGECREI